MRIRNETTIAVKSFLQFFFFLTETRDRGRARGGKNTVGSAVHKFLVFFFVRNEAVRSL